MAQTPVYLDFLNGQLVEAPDGVALKNVLPYDYVVCNTSNTDPANDLGYGTWTYLGSQTIGVTTVYYYVSIAP